LDNGLYRGGTPLLLFYRGAAIGHEIIQGSLRLFQVKKIPRLQHLASVAYHLIDFDRIVPAVIGAVVIDTTDILVLVW
jgi:hypothetical protein